MAYLGAEPLLQLPHKGLAEGQLDVFGLDVEGLRNVLGGHAVGLDLEEQPMNPWRSLHVKVQILCR